MSESKKSLNNPEEVLPSNTEIERLLLPRLKFMGGIFFCLSVVSLLFAFFIHDEKFPKHIPFTLNEQESSILADIEKLAGTPLFKEMQPLEIPPQEVFNFYVVSAIFASIGGTLTYVATQKQKKYG